MKMAVDTIRYTQQRNGFVIDGLDDIIFPTNTLMVVFQKDISRGNGFIEFSFYIPNDFLIKPSKNECALAAEKIKVNEIKNLAYYYYSEHLFTGMVLKSIPKLESSNVQLCSKINKLNNGSMSNVTIIKTKDGAYVCGIYRANNFTTTD